MAIIFRAPGTRQIPTESPFVHFVDSLTNELFKTSLEKSWIDERGKPPGPDPGQDIIPPIMHKHNQSY